MNVLDNHINDLDYRIQEICKAVQNEVGGAVQAVNFNCPGQVVIAGAVDPVNKAIEALKAAVISSVGC